MKNLKGKSLRIVFNRNIRVGRKCHIFFLLLPTEKKNSLTKPTKIRENYFNWMCEFYRELAVHKRKIARFLRAVNDLLDS